MKGVKCINKCSKVDKMLVRWLGRGGQEEEEGQVGGNK